MKGLGKKELSSPLSSIHILYNQPLVGGLSGQPAPGTRMGNVSLDGGSTFFSTCRGAPATRYKQAAWWWCRRCGADVWIVVTVGGQVNYEKLRDV